LFCFVLFCFFGLFVCFSVFQSFFSTRESQPPLGAVKERASADKIEN